MNYFLDTNLLLVYIRNNLQAKQIEKDLQLFGGRHNLITSVVSVGELKSIAKQHKWGNRRITEMEDVLSDFLIADINSEDVLERYAEIDAFSQGKLTGIKSEFSSRNMGKNDLWIAATASILQAQFLTTDKDFEHLADKYLKLQTIRLEDYTS